MLQSISAFVYTDSQSFHCKYKADTHNQPLYTAKAGNAGENVTFFSFFHFFGE